MRTEIEKNVMGGVAAIYAVRHLKSLAAVKLYVLAGSLFCLASIVSVPHVAENLLSVGFAGFPAFALSALEHTTIIVQVGLAVGTLALASFAADVVRRREDRHFAL